MEKLCPGRSKQGLRASVRPSRVIFSVASICLCSYVADPDATIFLLSHYPSIPLSAQEFIAKSQVLKDELFKTVQPLPGALNFITHLHKHNIKIAVATSSTRANFEKKASHLSHLFDLFGNKIICADDGYFPKGRGKPCPDIFLAAASLLGAEVGLGEDDVSDIQQEIRQRCVVFEDAVPGVQAGVRAGMGGE
jgi:pseudouridine 5'-phosphatase